MNIRLSSIVMDLSIQCRDRIDQGVVNDYAQKMSGGDTFPPVELYGDEKRCWIGDGWHRIRAAQDLDYTSITATLHPGGRVDALKHALGANVLHGLRRSNKDKDRCIEIGLREFPKLTDSALGKLCGVDHKTVASYRPVTLGNSQPEKRIGVDGKMYPAPRVKPKSGKPEKQNNTPKAPEKPAVQDKEPEVGKQETPLAVAPAVTTPPPTAEQPPPTVPCPPAAVPVPSSSSTGGQQASPSARPDLLAAWAAASSADRSAFLRQLVANVPLAQHTAAWGAISSMILGAHEKAQ